MRYHVLFQEHTACLIKGTKRSQWMDYYQLFKFINGLHSKVLYEELWMTIYHEYNIDSVEYNTLADILHDYPEYLI